MSARTLVAVGGSALAEGVMPPGLRAAFSASGRQLTGVAGGAGGYAVTTARVRRGPLRACSAAVSSRAELAEQAATAMSFSELNAEIARDVPPECAAAARAINLTARHRRAVVHEIMLMTRSHGQPPGLGGLPLTVLTAAARDDAWMQMQAELAGLSTASRHIVAAHGGHYFQRDEPDLVASAIRDLMARIREPATSLPR